MASVEWSFAWLGRGIDVDSSSLLIDFIGASVGLVVSAPLASDVGGSAGIGGWACAGGLDAGEEGSAALRESFDSPQEPSIIAVAKAATQIVTVDLRGIDEFILSPLVRGR